MDLDSQMPTGSCRLDIQVEQRDLEDWLLIVNIQSGQVVVQKGSQPCF